MFEFLNVGALLSPLIALTAAVVVFLKRGEKKNERAHRSLGLFVLGFLVVGAMFYVLGFLFGSYISCSETRYAECTLAGIILFGPLSFSISTGAYLYFWVFRKSSGSISGVKRAFPE